MANNFYEKTAKVYSEAGLNVEAKDIEYFVAKTNPKNMTAIAGMTYLMFEELKLDSVSKYFGINQLSIAYEAFNINDDVLRILTSEPKDIIFNRKLSNEN